MRDLDGSAFDEPVPAPGSKPLASKKEEAYAQYRGLGYRQREAARLAGLDDYTGIFAKYEAKRRVRRRITYLRQDDQTNEAYQARRRHLEERLELVAFGNMFEYVRIIDGKPVIDWEELARSELGVTINELRINPETNRVTHIARDNALAAIGQLREMRGFKAVDHVRLSVGVEQLTDEELGRIAKQVTPQLVSPQIIDDEPATDGVEDDDFKGDD
jgi:hypothetical protein